MTDNIFLIDTDTLSYILKRREPVYARSQAYLRTHRKYAISSITYYECVRGYKAVNATRRLQIFYEFLDVVDVLDLDQQVLDQAADIYAELRPRGLFPGELDTLIGATALVHHLPCVTNNTDHYQRFHDYFGLEVYNWMDSTPPSSDSACEETSEQNMSANEAHLQDENE
jgi:predicted nucleic acid-binding protein